MNGSFSIVLQKAGWATARVFLRLSVSFFLEKFESLTLKPLHQNSPFLELMIVKLISTHSCDSVKLF